MSYIPLSSSEKQQKEKQAIEKYRNPIYPLLRYPLPKAVHTLQSQITSCLIFQQLVYFNWYFVFFQAYLYLSSQLFRFMYFEFEYDVPVRLIIFFIFLVLEIFRLQNAFHGNLTQSFPEICAFLFLTILTIIAQSVLMAISYRVPYSPMQFTCLIYGIIFHVSEFIVQIFSMGKLTQNQKALFVWKSPKRNKST